MPTPWLVALALLPLAATAAPPRLHVQPEQVRPGDPLLVTVHGADAAPAGRAGARELRFYRLPSGAWQALTGVPVEEAPGAVLPIRVTAGGAELAREAPVADPRFRTRELKVASKFTDEPPPDLKARIEADRAAFAAAFARELAPPAFRADFRLPRRAKVTGRYGDRRTFNGTTASQHYGTDLTGAVGAPVAASNAGTVVLARDCHASGQTVLLHHGAGLFTAYFHLSRVDVTEGQQVEAGAPLGAVGATGRVTGPHLHWGARVDGLWVDPERLLGLRFFGAAAPKAKGRAPAP